MSGFVDGTTACLHCDNIVIIDGQPNCMFHLSRIDISMEQEALECWVNPIDAEAIRIQRAFSVGLKRDGDNEAR